MPSCTGDPAMKEFSGMSNEQVRAMTFEIARDQ